MSFVIQTILFFKYDIKENDTSVSREVLKAELWLNNDSRVKCLFFQRGLHTAEKLTRLHILELGAPLRCDSGLFQTHQNLQVLMTLGAYHFPRPLHQWHTIVQQPGLA